MMERQMQVGDDIREGVGSETNDDLLRRLAEESRSQGLTLDAIERASWWRLWITVFIAAHVFLFVWWTAPSVATYLRQIRDAMVGQ